MRKGPAKKMKVSTGVAGAIGAAVVGAMAGAAAIFLSKKENREMVKKNVNTAVKKSKDELAKAGKKISATKKKLFKKR